MHYDIIIVGGGLVGKCIASALRHAPHHVALIDAQAHDLPDPRLIALNHGSVAFFKKIGLWSTIESFAAPIEQVHVSHRGRFGTTRLMAEDIGLAALGYVVRAKEINRALAEIPASSTQLRPATVTNVESHPTHTTLTLEDGTTITGDLIIAADGTHSTIRKLLNFTTETLDYQQSAIVTTTTLARSHQHIAYERFLDDGAIAMLPLIDNDNLLCATIWTASTKYTADLMQLSDDDFIKKLQEQFGYRLGRLQKISQRYMFPLHCVRVKNPMQNNIILLGNAAHTLHPIAAQGLNIALNEIAHLTQLILSNLENQKPLTHELSYPPQKLNLLLSHYLTSLFSYESWGIPFIRKLGMVGLDLCSPLKKRFSRALAGKN